MFELRVMCTGGCIHFGLVFCSDSELGPRLMDSRPLALMDEALADVDPERLADRYLQTLSSDDMSALNDFLSLIHCARKA